MPVLIVGRWQPARAGTADHILQLIAEAGLAAGWHCDLRRGAK